MRRTASEPHHADLPIPRKGGHLKQTTDTSSEPLSRIRALIEEGQYRPGMMLPSERVLASQLKVGRPAVREALKALSILDVVESRRGKGSYIKCLAALHAGWPENVRHIGADLDMLELLEVRKMLEPRAAALAAMRATEQQIGEMERELIAQQTHINNRKLATNKHDYLFHDAIIRAAGNGILQELNRFLTPLLLKSRQITSQIPPDLTHMIREHQAIIEAIRVGEPELAARAMHDHLQNVGLELISGRVRMKIGAVQTN